MNNKELKMRDRLKVLSDSSRLTILQLVAKGSISSCCNRIELNESGCCVADVVELTGLSQPTVSHHLKILEECKLIRREKRGTWACFFPNPTAIEELCTWLQEIVVPKTENSSNCGC